MDTNRSYIIPDDRRMFHREDFDVDIIREVKGYEKVNNYTYSFTLNTQNDKEYYLNVIAYDENIFRVQLGKDKNIINTTMIDLDKSQNENLEVQIEETEELYILKNKKSTLKVHKNLFNLSLHKNSGELIWDLENTDKKSWCVTPAMGYRVSNDKKEESPFLSFRIKNNENLYGLGEKFNSINKRETRATIWAADTMGTNTTDMSYKSVPVLLSTSGWGMMMYTSYKSFWEIGSFSYTTASVLVEDNILDFFLFTGNDIKELTKEYCNLVAKPMLPPKWSLGVWMSKCSYNTTEEIHDVVNKLKEKRIPIDVINVDTAWLSEIFYHTIGVDACDFKWNSKDLHDRKELFKWLKDNGKDICVWINPYIPEHVELYKEAASKGYLVKDVDGGIARIESGNPAAMVDFTNEEAVKWWQAYLAEFINDGISCTKPDYADRIPCNGLFSNGKTGKELHNIYPHLYNKAVHEITKELTGENIMFRRSGYIGSNKYPVTWAGDTQTTWVAMQCVLRGGLSAGITGEAFWSHDIGGFTGPKPSDEMYVRWSQLGLLSSISRYHGTTPREPWEYNERAEEIVSDFIRFRYRLMPYLWEMTNIAHETGLPLMRHLIMEYPNDPAVTNIEDEYMLGDRLLVAPVLTPETESRYVYFPEGKWMSIYNDSEDVIVGGKYIMVDSPLEKIPVYIKENCVIPMHAVNIMSTKDKVQEYELVVFMTDSNVEYSLRDEKVEIDFTATINGSTIEYSLKHNIENVKIKFLGLENKEIIAK